jgi:hypothetical protein
MVTGRLSSDGQLAAIQVSPVNVTLKDSKLYVHKNIPVVYIEPIFCVYPHRVERRVGP